MHCKSRTRHLLMLVTGIMNISFSAEVRLWLNPRRRLSGLQSSMKQGCKAAVEYTGYGVKIWPDMPADSRHDRERLGYELIHKYLAFQSTQPRTMASTTVAQHSTVPVICSRHDPAAQSGLFEQLRSHSEQVSHPHLIKPVVNVNAESLDRCIYAALH